MTDIQQRILDAIPYGQENAIKCCSLALRTGLDDREVQEVIQSIINDEIVPVCSSCDGIMGYFRPTRRSDMTRYHVQLAHRTDKTLDRLVHSRKMMDRDFPVEYEEMGVGF